MRNHYACSPAPSHLVALAGIAAYLKRERAAADATAPNGQECGDSDRCELFHGSCHGLIAAELQAETCHH